jgi:hypothetical protein
VIGSREKKKKKQKKRQSKKAEEKGSGTFYARNGLAGGKGS